MIKTRLTHFIAFAWFMVSAPTLAVAQSAATPSEPTVADSLALTQEQLADKYQRLEMLMLKMAEVDASENPQRSALLKKAIAQSKNKFIKRNMDDLVNVLHQERYRNAIAGQSGVRNDLKLLLELLENENRTDRIKDEQDRVRQYIRELKRIIRQQKSVQGRTESGEETNRLSDAQQKVAERADSLAKEISDNESPPSDETENDSASEQGSNSDGEKSEDAADRNEQPQQNDSDDAEPSNSEDGSPAKDSDNQSSDGDAQSNEGKPDEENPTGDDESDDADSKDQSKDQSRDENSESSPPDGKQAGDENSKGKPSNGKSPKDGKQSPGEPNEGGEQSPADEEPENAQPQQQEDNFPGKKRIAAAEKKMKQASKKLSEAERKGAIEDQEEARRLLELAQAELEEILRQLREEEVERTLTQLETRFRKMLAMQIAVFDDTQRLVKIPEAKRNKSFQIQSNKVALAERRIVDEADRAILLLVEEGSSVAFPEATEQMRGDMEQIAKQLSEANVSQMTVGLEEDVITALEEMIAALQQAQKDAEERKQQQQQPQQQNQQGGEQDQPLVNAIEELKMIRALQMRVNKRTDRYSKMIADADDPVGQATDPEIIESLEQLAEREARIQSITSDIVAGKTR